MPSAPIVIDPAHGGSQAAGKSSPFGHGLSAGPEKDLTLQLAQGLSHQLSRQVLLTRDGDFNLSLGQRQQVVRQAGGAVFLSLHASSDERPRIFLHPRAGAGSRALAQDLAGALGASLREDVELAILHPEGLATDTDACMVDLGDAAMGWGGTDDLLHRLAWGLQSHLERWRGGRYRAGADLVPPPSYAPTSSSQAARDIQAWQNDLDKWIMGVPAAATGFFPHTAICKLAIHTNLGVLSGSGFYIAPDRIMTAGHCVTGFLPDGRRYTATHIVAQPALGAAMSVQPVTIQATNFAVHPGWLASASTIPTGSDVAVLRTDTPPLDGAYFSLEQLDFNPAGGITVCGYPGAPGTHSDNLQQSIPHDPNIQHLSRNSVVDLFPDGEGFYTGAQGIGGESGSPVFYSDGARIKAVAVLSAYNGARRLYQVCALTTAKIQWALRTPFQATTPWPPHLGARHTAPRQYGQGSTWDWLNATEDQRFLHVMERLVDVYHLPVNGAAGMVGNLYAESQLIPARIEGSAAATPMRAQDHSRHVVDFTPEQIMNRTGSTGPRLPGVGLAQWTSRNRRAGLFTHTWEGITLGPEILYNMDAQIDYLVWELAHSYAGVDRVLRNAGVTVHDAADEVAYTFERPGVCFQLDAQNDFVRDAQGHLILLPRTHQQVVQRLFQHRRPLADRALRIYRAAHP
ncbi:MAG: phage tail tip lysozyme [Pseudomonadota bacterium]